MRIIVIDHFLIVEVNDFLQVGLICGKYWEVRNGPGGLIKIWFIYGILPVGMLGLIEVTFTKLFNVLKKYHVSDK